MWLALILWIPLLIWNVSIADPSRAQSSADRSELVVLWEAATDWTRPTVVATSWGHVHVIWADKYGGQEAGAEADAGKGDTLYHAFWDGHAWSGPLDVLAMDPRALSMVYPTAVIGEDDQIYLIWSGENALYFSQAYALRAHNAASWQPVQPIAQGMGIDRSSMVVGPEGQLHVVFAKLQDQLGGNVVYLSSADRGVNWSAPEAVSEIRDADEVVSADPDLVLDDRGWLHVVWTERSPPDWVGHRILYSRSEDGGQTWTQPTPLAENRQGEKWAESPSLVTTDGGDLHLVWVCGESPNRCYRTSKDGGYSWATGERILGELLGRGGWDAMVADHEGNLHFLALLRYPEGIYYASRLAGGRWQSERIVDHADYWEGHYFQMTLSGGNQLHAVWQKSAQEGDIVHLRISTSASELALSGIPTVTHQPEGTLGQETQTPVSTQDEPAGQLTPEPSPEIPNSQERETSTNSPLIVLLWALIPSAVLIAIVVVLRLRK